MKKTLLYLLFLLTSLNFYAQISIVSPIIHCNGDTLFDLTIRESEIIGDLNPAETTISYHLSNYDASRGAYAITNPTSYQSTAASTNIYARIINERNFTATVKSFLLNVNRSPLVLNAIIKYSGCSTVIILNASGGTFSYQYSKDGVNYQIEPYFYNLSPGTHTIYTKDSNNCTATTTMVVEDITIPPLVVQSVATMPRCNGASDAQIMTFVSGGTPPYILSILEKPDAFITMNNDLYTTHNMSAGRYTVHVKDASGVCAEINPIEIQEPKVLSATATITDQTITVNATGGTGKYIYSINRMPYQPSNVFTITSVGIYDVTIQDENGCLVSISIKIDVQAPLVDGKNEITLEYKSGQTLADIIVKGQNIKWYSTKNNSTGRTNKMSKTTETTLPLTTVLVDNTTYYASQTINDIESKERLAVTVKLNTLSNPDFELSSFKYHPNPVKNILSIENSSVIDEVTLFSVAGNIILDKKINSLHSDLNLSHVATGIYILKVKSDGQEKAIKIVKE